MDFLDIMLKNISYRQETDIYWEYTDYLSRKEKTKTPYVSMPAQDPSPSLWSTYTMV